MPALVLRDAAKHIANWILKPIFGGFHDSVAERSYPRTLEESELCKPISLAHLLFRRESVLVKVLIICFLGIPILFEV